MRTLRILALLVVAALAGCDGCRRSAAVSGGFRFPDGAARAAALPWQPWSPAVLAQAKETGKPVLVSFVRPLCQRCDLLDTATLSSERVAEVLQDKFLLVRVDGDADPVIASRLAEGYPSLVVLNAEGDALWQGGLVQPGMLTQLLFEALRGDVKVKLPAARPRYLPVRKSPDVNWAFNLSDYLIGKFDPKHRGYTTPKGLAVSWMQYDLLLGGMEFAKGSAATRFALHVGGLWEGAHDARDGGFIAGAVNADWRAVVPIKFAHDQAEVAAVFAALAAYPRWHYYLEKPVTAYVEAAFGAVTYLEERLVTDDGRVAYGEMATPAYYDKGDRSRRPVVDENAHTDVAGRTAAALARAGLWASKPEFTALAAKIAERALQDRRPNGLFYHTPAAAAAPDRLDDAAAMLDAAVALYQAGAGDRWLAEARAVARAIAPLRMQDGYFVDVTEASGYPPEPLPLANLRAARALWALGAIDNDVELRRAAFAVVEAFAGDPYMFDDEQGVLAMAVWEVSGRFVRIEAPRRWLGDPAAAGLVRSPRLRRYVKWTEDTQGRVCDGVACGAFSADPAALVAAADVYFASGELK